MAESNKKTDANAEPKALEPACNIQNVEKKDRCLLAVVDTKDPSWDIETSLEELERLADTAGGEVVGTFVQKLDRPFIKSYFGSGKLTELREYVRANDVDVVIIDDEISPIQQNAISKHVGGSVRVIDRPGLILDIFGKHATTHEGKIQVQMAQLEYLYPRLRGMWAHLSGSKTKGGIGSRFGGGESQLELDRRIIRNRISNLKHALEELKRTKSTQRKGRNAGSTFRMSLVGYTNAGKSTLLNALTDAAVYMQDKLFATLDPTTRKFELPCGASVTLTDTVGFIQRLPTTLVASFESTLAEISESDFLLLVVDASDRNYPTEIQTVLKVLKEIEADGIPYATVFNKVDRLDEETLETLKGENPEAFFVSALEKEGLGEVVAAIEAQRGKSEEVFELTVGFQDMALVNGCHEQGTVYEEEYLPEGIRLKVGATGRLRSVLAKIVRPEDEEDY